jgi:hypothetical protein
MPMEHLRENGELSQGYFCSQCGQPCGMYGHDNGCKSDKALVKKLTRINEAGSMKVYIMNKLKGKYDD